MKYQFFGDTHGETHWKELVNPECIQVFLGDYFSPYRGQSFEQCMNNFMEILKFKEDHPETILLLGNHDEDHWHIQEHYSRFDPEHVDIISQVFEEEKEKFQVAVAIGNYLVTHAGVSKEWCNRILPDVEINPQSLAEAINKKWLDGKYTVFDFRHNSTGWDCYGTSEIQGPMWLRWNTLQSHNVFKKTPYKQIVGHTVDADFRYSPNKKEWNLICIDCMAYQGKSLILDI